MNRIDEIKEIIRDLISIEGEADWDLSAWQEKADSVYLLSKDIGSEVPEVVWHYLSDADIRVKEPNYGAHQIMGAKDFVDYT